jgi:hypothetical protein
LERETRILEKGRREDEGIEASKRVVGDEATILHVRVDAKSEDRRRVNSRKEEIAIQKSVKTRLYS